MQIDSLIKEWLECKTLENAYKLERLDVEKQIEEFYSDQLPEEGSKSFEVGDNKITLTKKMKYDLDEQSYLAIRPDIPSALRPENIKITLDLKFYRKLEEDSPDIHKLISNCITIKPEKTGFKIEPKKEKK